jgi:undecaprenyl pyrophosphate phosphatase UppP
MNYLKTKSFAPFVAYRVILGIAIALLVGFGVLTAS